MRRTALIAAALVAAACSIGTSAPSGGHQGKQSGGLTTLPKIVPTTAAACAKALGDWSRQGLLGGYMCVMRFADAGKKCSSGSECIASCRTDSSESKAGKVVGRCQATTSPFGCYANVEQGKAKGAICVD